MYRHIKYCIRMRIVMSKIEMVYFWYSNGEHRDLSSTIDHFTAHEKQNSQ